MSDNMKAKIEGILRGYNSVVLTLLGFFLVAYYNSSDKKFEKLDDVIIKQAVMEEIIKNHAVKHNLLDYDISNIKSRIEELRLKVNTN